MTICRHWERTGQCVAVIPWAMLLPLFFSNLLVCLLDNNRLSQYYHVSTGHGIGDLRKILQWFSLFARTYFERQIVKLPPKK